MDRPARFRKALRGKPPRRQFVYGVFVAAETVDANLSQVRIPGGASDGTDATLRFVPKGEHVTGLAAGNTVLLVGSPHCIIAKVVGDASLAEV